MAKPKIHLEGLRELDRALKHADEDARANLRGALKDAAGVVAGTAQTLARAKGLVDTGKLVRSIKPGLSGAAAVVRVGAKRAGYPYPAVYEFGGGGARAFLFPAAKRDEDEVRELAEKAVAEAIRAAGLH